MQTDISGGWEAAERTNAEIASEAIWIYSREDLPGMLEHFRNAAGCVLDLETTGLDEYARTAGESNGGVAARVALASFALPQKDSRGDWDGEEPPVYVVPLSHPRSPWLGEWVPMLRLLARALVKYSVPVAGHNLKFDLRWVYATTGIDLSPLYIWDTLSGASLLDETKSSKLKEVVPREFPGVVRWDEHNLSAPGAAELVDIWELGDYCALDVYWCWMLMRLQTSTMFVDSFSSVWQDIEVDLTEFEGVLRDESPEALESTPRRSKSGRIIPDPVGPEEILEARLGKVAELVSMPTVRALTVMENRGMLLDLDYVNLKLEESLETASGALDWLADHFGVDRKAASTATASKWFREITTQAVEAEELKISGMTATGKVQWTKHILKKQARAGSVVAGKILEERGAAKQAQFLKSWLEKADSSGVIRPTYRAGYVLTGRLSSSNPNAQQISKELRKAFIPRPGYLIADLDYSQLELRVIAYMSRSEPMMAAYREGKDLHSLLAADTETRRRRHADPNAPAVGLDDVTAAQRQAAKASNFGLAYGQGVQGFRNYADAVYGVEFTEQEAQEAVDNYFQTWTGVAEWQRETIRKAGAQGYILSPIGRRRLLPDLLSNNSWMRGEAERQALNAPVQGFGSDLMQMASASILGIMPGSSRVEGAEPIATVHDSLVLEVKADRWVEITEECKYRMAHLEPWLEEMGVDMDVPLLAEAQVGTRWGLSDVSDAKSS